MSFLEYCADYPPPSESILILLTAFTNFKLPQKAGGRRVKESRSDDEIRDLSGLAMAVGVRTKGASSLPDYMKEVFNKDFNLNIPIN